MKDIKRAVLLAIIIISIFVSLKAVGLKDDQVLATTIFAFIIISSLFYWRLKLAFALIGVALMLLLRLVTVEYLVKYASLDVILFLISMMIVVGFLEEKQFFEHLISIVVAKTGQSAKIFMSVMMLLSGIFAALVGGVTSILFMMSSLLHITGKIRVNPTPFIVMIVFATNIGSGATVIGNPAGIIIAMKSGLTFTDFVIFATPVSFLCLIIAIVVSMLIFKEDIQVLDEHLRHFEIREEKEEQEAQGRLLCWVVFIFTLVGLFMHHQVEEIFHLERNSLLIGIPLISAGIVLALEAERARELVERRVEWITLVFFMMLFSAIGALEYVGIPEVIAESLSEIPGGEVVQLVVFTVVVGILSAFLDNVLAVAAIAPVIEKLAIHGMVAEPFWWAALFAGTFFGNLTIIGSAVNIIALGILEKRRLGHVSFTKWFKAGALVTLVTTIPAILILIARLHL